MYATLSSFLSFLITSSPTWLLLSSFFSSFLSSASISSTARSIFSCGIGLFSHAFVIPVRSFSRLNGSLRPSFLTTTRSNGSILSYVVNRFLHRRHSLLRLVASLASRLSTTRCSGLSQYGQFIFVSNSCSFQAHCSIALFFQHGVCLSRTCNPVVFPARYASCFQPLP